MGQNASGLERKPKPHGKAFRQAAKHGQTELLISLMQQRPCLLLSASWPSGFTALHHAARKGQSAALVAILDALQQSGHMLAKPAPQLDAVTGALTWRLQPPAQSRAGVVQQVLDTMTTRGCTALMLAAHHGRCEALQVLLAAGADALVLDKGDRRTALHHAAMMGHADAVCTLLNASITVNAPAGQQTVVLGSAQLRDGTKQVARYIDARTRSGLSALHLACFFGCGSVVKALIAGGASLHVDASRSLEAMPCDAGSTALHLAAIRGHSDIALLLLQTHMVRMLSENAEVRGDGRFAWEGTEEHDPRMHYSARRETPYMLALEFGRSDMAALLDPQMPISWLSPNGSVSLSTGVPKLRVIAGHALHQQLVHWLDNFDSQHPSPCTAHNAASDESHSTASYPNTAAGQHGNSTAQSSVLLPTCAKSSFCTAKVHAGGSSSSTSQLHSSPMSSSQLVRASSSGSTESSSSSGSSSSGSSSVADCTDVLGQTYSYRQSGICSNMKDAVTDMEFDTVLAAVTLTTGTAASCHAPVQSSGLHMPADRPQHPNSASECEDVCGVCLDHAPVLVLRPCGHALCGHCTRCLLETPRRPSLCPFCRQTLGSLQIRNHYTALPSAAFI